MPKITFHLPLVLAALIFIPYSTHAEESLISENELMQSLQTDMEMFAEMATETKQNVDYMPYVISTLRSDQLIKLGVTTLRDALKLVPGVDISVGMAGVKNPIFRGSNPYSFGQSKLFINGVLMNDQVFGAYNQYLEMPIDVIHRIEVVRGPGSLSGYMNGYAGSINVITKSHRDDGEEVKNELFVGVGSQHARMIGGVFSSEHDELKISGDMYVQKHELEIPSSVDRFGRDGTFNEVLDNYQVGLNLEYKGLSVQGRFSSNDSGTSSGQAFSLSDDFSDYLKVDNNALDIKYKTSISSGVDIEFSVGYLDEHRQLQNKVMPDGSMMMMPGMGMVTLPNGRYFVVDFIEATYKQQLEIDIRKFDKHRIRAGLFLSQSRVVQDDSGISQDNLATISEFGLFTNEYRDYRSLYLEDIYSMSDAISIQYGMKLEAYSDVDSQFSPRMAVVYRYDDNNIFKAMYTHAYREPSWREQYTSAQSVFYRPNENLEVELVDAYELAYIHKIDAKSDFKVNLFYLENRNQMQADLGMDQFENRKQNELYGVELEHQHGFANGSQLNFSYSYVEGNNIGDELANASSQMAGLSYIYPLSTEWSASALYKYVGEKQRIEIDPREAIDGYSTIDLALQYNSRSLGLILTAGVKNAFDNDVLLPAPVGTYVDDFNHGGRHYFLRLSKEL